MSHTKKTKKPSGKNPKPKRKPKSRLNESDLEKVRAADVANLIRKVSNGGTLTGPQWARLQQFADAKPAGQEVRSEARNIVDLCTALGIERRTYYRYRGNKDSPKKHSNGTYDIVAWRLYLEKCGAVDPQGGAVQIEEKRGLEIDHLRLRCGILAIEYKKAQQESISTDLVVEWIHNHIGIVKKRLLSLPPTLAPQLTGLSTKKIAKRLKEEVHGLLREFSDYKFGDTRASDLK